MLQARVAALHGPFASYDYVDAMFTKRAPAETRQMARLENQRFDRAAAAALLWDAALHEWRWSAVPSRCRPSLTATS